MYSLDICSIGCGDNSRSSLLVFLPMKYALNKFHFTFVVRRPLTNVSKKGINGWATTERDVLIGLFTFTHAVSSIRNKWMEKKYKRGKKTTMQSLSRSFVRLFVWFLYRFVFHSTDAEKAQEYSCASLTFIWQSTVFGQILVSNRTQWLFHSFLRLSSMKEKKELGSKIAKMNWKPFTEC